VNNIPPAFQYPEIACACINIGDRESRKKTSKRPPGSLRVTSFRAMSVSVLCRYVIRKKNRRDIKDLSSKRRET